jgi:hypothetical protein
VRYDIYPIYDIYIYIYVVRRQRVKCWTDTLLRQEELDGMFRLKETGLPCKQTEQRSGRWYGVGAGWNCSWL